MKIKKLLTAKQYADMVGVTVQTVNEWDTQGRLEVVKTPGGHRRIVVYIEMPDGAKIIGQIDDYDCGLINDYGGGNIQWWQDYIREEIGRCNDYWREQIELILSE